MSTPSSKPSTVPSTGASTPTSLKSKLKHGKSSGKSATTMPSTITDGSNSEATTAPTSGAATPQPPETDKPAQAGDEPPTLPTADTADDTANPDQQDTQKEEPAPAQSPPATPKRRKSSLDPPKKDHEGKHRPCPPHLCTLVPTDVPAPEFTQAILHPRKDVFVLKVAKVGPHGDRRCRMELELVTPKAQDLTPPYRTDTRETQCDPECTCCCSRAINRKTKKA